MKYSFADLKEIYVSYDDMPVREYSNEEKDKIVKYLTSHDIVAVIPGARYDVFDSERKSLGKEISLDVRSDGEYEWLEQYSYYVKKYNMALPEEFLAKILKETD